jgi:copper homeostasis protein
MQICVEVCVASIECAQIAQHAGAHRIELNTALELDGLSPTPGLLMGVLENTQLPVISMVRPRSGDFCYSDAEWKILKEDASWMLDMGARGIAVGCLDENRQIDESRLDEIRELAHDREVVFHLAFDEISDWKNAVDVLVQHQIDRLMTRGRMPTALAGAAQIRQVIEYAGNRIEVLPAGQIVSSNVKTIVEKTGCNQIHGSFSSGVENGATPGKRLLQIMAEIQGSLDQLVG